MKPILVAVDKQIRNRKVATINTYEKSCLMGRIALCMDAFDFEYPEPRCWQEEVWLNDCYPECYEYYFDGDEDYLTIEDITSTLPISCAAISWVITNGVLKAERGNGKGRPWHIDVESFREWLNDLLGEDRQPVWRRGRNYR
jgi:hypothetical protein